MLTGTFANTVLSTLPGKTKFAWRFTLNKNTLTMSYQKLPSGHTTLK